MSRRRVPRRLATDKVDDESCTPSVDVTEAGMSRESASICRCGISQRDVLTQAKAIQYDRVVERDGDFVACGLGHQYHRKCLLVVCRNQDRAVHPLDTRTGLSDALQREPKFRRRP